MFRLVLVVPLMNRATGDAAPRAEHSAPFWCVPHSDTVDTDFSGNDSCKQPRKCLMRLRLCALWLRVSPCLSQASRRWSPLKMSLLFIRRLSYLVCYCQVFGLHCAIYIARAHTRMHKHTHDLPLLPSPKGLVWFMPFVRVWVGLKEIMVRLLWNCGSFLNWSLFSHVHHIHPVHSKSHIKALKNLPSYSVNSEVHRTELFMSTMAKKIILKKWNLDGRQLHHIFKKCDLTYFYLLFLPLEKHAQSKYSYKSKNDCPRC